MIFEHRWESDRIFSSEYQAAIKKKKNKFFFNFHTLLTFLPSTEKTTMYIFLKQTEKVYHVKFSKTRYKFEVKNAYFVLEQHHTSSRDILKIKLNIGSSDPYLPYPPFCIQTRGRFKSWFLETNAKISG